MTSEVVDSEMVSLAIAKIPREVFFKTPYWIAACGEALRRAAGRCSQCGRTEKLSIRLRREEWRGSIHTEQGLREILCVCERCKNTHILISNSPN